jgi:hypothetical protein
VKCGAVEDFIVWGYEPVLAVATSLWAKIYIYIYIYVYICICQETTPSANELKSHHGI